MKKLTSDEKKSGQKNYLAFCAMNGLSIAFLAETTLILYALKIGIPDYIVAVVASFAFLGTFFVIAGRHLIRKIGVTRAASWSWYMRNIFGAFTALAPIFMVHYSPFMGVIIILIGSLGFYAFRGVGMAALLPIVGEITEGEEKGKFNSKTSFSFNAGYFIAMTLLIVLFRVSDKISTFQFIIVVGFFVGCYSGYRVSRIHESGAARESASFSFKESFKFCLSCEAVRKLLIVQTICYSCMALVLPYSVMALKEVYEVRDYRALFFVLLQGGGAMLMALLCSKISGRNTFRRIMIYSYFFLMLVVGMWIFMPKIFVISYAVLLFVLSGVGLIGIYISLAQYFLTATPPERLVGSNIVISVISCTIAGIVGAFSGAVILESLEYLNLSEITLYRIFFTIVLFALLIGFYTILRIEKVGIRYLNPFAKISDSKDS